MKRRMTAMMAVFLALVLCGCDAVGMLFETEPPQTEDLSGIIPSMEKITGYLNMQILDSEGSATEVYRIHEPSKQVRLGTLRVVEAPDLGRSDRWLVIFDGNDRQTLTVYDGYRDLICHQNGASVKYYEDDDGKTMESLRWDLDEMEYEDRRHLEFMAEDTLVGPMGEFAGTIYPAFRKGLTEGNRFCFEDYDLIDYAVDEQSDTKISGVIHYYAVGDASAMPETREPGSGKYEGWYYCTETVLLELDENGIWHRVDAFSEPVPDETQDQNTAE